ncbi:MAG: AsmA family protein [Desulfobulbus sp.]|nr:AsmA family protein [Desulfobulbus sp.]
MHYRSIGKACLAVLIVAAIALGGGFIALQSVNTTTIKDVITTQVRAVTGRTLLIGGPLKLQWGLVPSLVTTDVSLSNPAGSSRPEMVRLQRLELEISLMPLLHREIVVHRLILTEPDVLLETEMEGPGNLDFTPVDDASRVQALDKQLSELPADSGAFTSFQFIVKELKIIGGHLTWHDRDMQKTESFPIHHLIMQPETADQELLRIDLSTTLQGHQVAVKGQIGSPFTPDQGKPWPVDLDMTTTGLHMQVHGSVADIAAQQGVALAFTVDGTEFSDAVRLLGLDSPYIPPHAGSFHCTGQMNGDISQLHLDKFLLTAGDKQLLLLTAEGAIRDLAGTMTVDMDAAINSTQPSTLAEQAGLTYHGRESFHLAGHIHGSGSSWKISKIQAEIGANNLAGDLNVQVGERLTVTGAVSSTFFNPADFLNSAPEMAAAEKRSQETTGAKQTHRVFPQTPLPLNLLTRINADLSLQIKELPISGQRLQNIALTAALHNGRLQVHPLYCELAGGILRADVTVDAAGSVPLVTLQIQGNRIVIDRLIENAVISGAQGELKINLTARGNSIATLMATSSGEASLRIGEGRLRNTTLDSFSGDIFAQIIRLINPFTKREASSKLVCAAARFIIRDGMATADQGIGLRTSQVDVLGSGTVNLRSEKIEFYITPKPHGQTGISLATPLAGLVRIEGTLGAPSVGIDTSGVLKTATSVGVGIATGGLSTLGEFLLDRTKADVDPCQTALGLTPKTKPSPQSSSPLKNVGKPLQKLFGR